MAGAPGARGRWAGLRIPASSRMSAASSLGARLPGFDLERLEEYEVSQLPEMDEAETLPYLRDMDELATLADLGELRLPGGAEASFGGSFASASSLGVFVFFSAQARVTTPRRAIASAERPFFATETLSSDWNQTVLLNEKI